MPVMVRGTAGTNLELLRSRDRYNIVSLSEKPCQRNLASRRTVAHSDLFQTICKFVHIGEVFRGEPG